MLTEIARQGARRMLAMALNVEAEPWIAGHRRPDRRAGPSAGRPQRPVAGAALVDRHRAARGRPPRAYDRRPPGSECEREKFTSKILAPHLRKTKSIDSGWS